MRHQKKGHKLGRTAAHRKRTLQALSSALIEHKRIRTTVPKAKALRPFIEPLITRAKTDTSHNRRQVFRHLQNKHAVTELFSEVGPMAADRPGGYTRIIKLGMRPGDGAAMAMIELVDYNDVQPETASSRRSSTRRGSGKGRRRRSSGSGSGSQGGAAQETKPEATAPQTADPQEQTDDVETAETERVEESAAEAQKTPVPERTGPTEAEGIAEAHDEDAGTQRAASDTEAEEAADDERADEEAEDTAEKQSAAASDEATDEQADEEEEGDASDEDEDKEKP